VDQASTSRQPPGIESFGEKRPTLPIGRGVSRANFSGRGKLPVTGFPVSMGRFQPEEGFDSSRTESSVGCFCAIAETASTVGDVTNLNCDLCQPGPGRT